jgi:hypothetical protein
MWMASDIATYIYHIGLEPFTKKEVHIARNLHDRKPKSALMQYFKPEK